MSKEECDILSESMPLSTPAKQYIENNMKNKILNFRHKIING